MPVFSNDIISEFLRKGEEDLCQKVHCVIDRISLKINRGIPVYELPDYCLGIRRITWLGRKVEPKNSLDSMDLVPTTVLLEIPGAFNDQAFSNDAFFCRSYRDYPNGIPLYYFRSRQKYNEIQFYPAPNRRITKTTVGLWGPAIPDRVIVEFYRLPDLTDETKRAPKFLRRRAIKNYVLARLYAMEGPMQDLPAAKYYEDKYNFYVEWFRGINGGVFATKRVTVPTDRRKVGRGVLPPNFPAPR